MLVISSNAILQLLPSSKMRPSRRKERLIALTSHGSTCTMILKLVPSLSSVKLQRYVINPVELKRQKKEKLTKTQSTKSGLREERKKKEEAEKKDDKKDEKKDEKKPEE